MAETSIDEPADACRDGRSAPGHYAGRKRLPATQ